MEPNKKISFQQNNLRFCDDRIELLDTIKELVKAKVNKRIKEINIHIRHRESPPPDTFLKSD